MTAETPQPVNGDRCVLVVDDSEDMRTLVCIWLRAQGLMVLEADGGEAALGILATNEIGAIVTDLHMPGMDGIGLLAQAKRRKPAVPVVLMTCDDHLSATEAVRLGAAGFFRKPMVRETLVAAVKRQLP